MQHIVSDLATLVQLALKLLVLFPLFTGLVLVLPSPAPLVLPPLLLGWCLLQLPQSILLFLVLLRVLELLL